MAVIRDFNIKDLGRIVHIAELSLQEQYSHDLFILIQESKNTVFYVADLHNTVVGYITGILSEKDARVLMLAVHPFYRRRGIGSELMDSFTNTCLSKGVRRITLEVRPSNKVAIEFYKKRGFHPIDIIKDFYTNGEEGIKMMKIF
ncbi:MAG: ribosomal protein S18-alanine N-acetyltransferase [Thermoplasmatota archaeon]